MASNNIEEVVTNYSSQIQMDNGFEQSTTTTTTTTTTITPTNLQHQAAVDLSNIDNVIINNMINLEKNPQESSSSIQIINQSSTTAQSFHHSANTSLEDPSSSINNQNENLLRLHHNPNNIISPTSPIPPPALLSSTVSTASDPKPPQTTTNSTDQSSTLDHSAVKSIVENVVENLLAKQQSEEQHEYFGQAQSDSNKSISDIKQEFRDKTNGANNQNKIDGSNSGLRKSTRLLRTRISAANNKIRKSDELHNRSKSSSSNITEQVQISIDPSIIHHRNSDDPKNGRLIDDEFDDNNEDDEMYEDINGDDDDDDDEFTLDEELDLASNNAKKKRRLNNDGECDNDRDYQASVDENHGVGATSCANVDAEDLLDIDDDDDDDDDDFDDEFRPLKKRKLPRKKPVRKTSTNQSMKAKLAKNQEILRLQKILYKLRSHQMLVTRLNQMLIRMNACLTDKMFALITEDNEALRMNKSNIPPTLLVDSFRLLHLKKNIPDNDNFVTNYGDMIQQYQSLVQERKEMVNNIDEDVEQSVVVKSIGKLIKKSKKKFSMLEIIGETLDYMDSDPFGKQKTIKKSRAKPKSNDGTDDGGTKSGSESITNVGSKRKRSRKPRQSSTTANEGGDDDKKCYLPCPWPNCTYESKREWALNEHINLTHTGLKQFGCKVDGCPATFFGSSELDNHMKKYHAEVAVKEFMPCTWPGCNALFKSKLGLRAHVQVHKGENLIPCDWPGCNYLAKNKRQHENHTRKHTGDRPFSCDYPGCDSKFRTNDSLRHHKKSHSEYRPFRCDWPGCEANFKTNRGLTIHRALHTGEKLFKCDWPDCDFASERKYHVDLHIYEDHTHVKPYQCTWTGCDASFLRNDKLQNHLKIHRQEKPFKCIHPVCDKHFVEKGNMMKHYNNVHKR